MALAQAVLLRVFGAGEEEEEEEEHAPRPLVYGQTAQPKTGITCGRVADVAPHTSAVSLIGRLLSCVLALRRDPSSLLGETPPRSSERPLLALRRDPSSLLGETPPRSS
ncbi:hypothetical protein EYF80_000300 [Liparis tanakae]|uniref:Uncharacterized protein n=1 Tax=Liparis tanakae TaxID=230148 RepID=A0A4Z2JI93_9TELE|nr:hypothetical protein EYF80_000300 [Liparis tanakae]